MASSRRPVRHHPPGVLTTAVAVMTVLGALCLVVGAGDATTAQAQTGSTSLGTFSGLIAYQSSRSGHPEIYTMTSTGTETHRLTDSPSCGIGLCGNMYPSFSPDGSKIVYVTNDNELRFTQIWVMDADGANAQMITEVTSAMTPVFSPDGTKIAFARYTGQYDIWVMDADGSNQTNLTSSLAGSLYPSWSPDGTKIAFETVVEGDHEIFTMNADGTGQTNVSNTTGWDATPTWSPDGTEIAFQGVRTPSGLYVMNADGTGQTFLPGTTVNDEFPQWSPDGTTIAFTRMHVGLATDEVYRITADGSAGPVRLTYSNPASNPENWFPSWQSRTGPDPNGDFTPVTPARVLDTRDGTGRNGNRTPLGSGQSFDVQITGQGGVAPFGVSAVVLNATVTNPTGASYLTTWPTGLTRPTASNLNFVPGQTVPNLVTVPVGAGGKVSVFNNWGSVDVIFDVVGYYNSSGGTPGSRFQPMSPYRYFDTRTGSGGVPATPIAQGGTLEFQVRGKGGVPATGVTAVVMNVTVTGPTSSSFLTVWPDDVTRPTASNLNFVPGQTVPNLVTVRVPASGVVDFYNNAGSVNVIADVAGYWNDDTTTDEGRFVPVVPTRLLDTRLQYGPLGPGDTGVLRVASPEFGIGAIAVNTTVTNPTAPSYLTVFPNDVCAVPLASNLNYVGGQTVPNLVLVRVSDDAGCASAYGEVAFYNNAGDADIIVDLFGYFFDPNIPLAAGAGASAAPMTRSADWNSLDPEWPAVARAAA